DGIRDFHVTGVQTCALPILALHDAPSVELQTVTAVPRWIASLLARLSAAARSFVCAVVRLLLMKALKLGTPTTISVAATASVVISSRSVNPRGHALSVRPEDLVSRTSSSLDADTARTRALGRECRDAKAAGRRKT